jgi:hypothetical protein
MKPIADPTEIMHSIQCINMAVKAAKAENTRHYGKEQAELIDQIWSDTVETCLGIARVGGIDHRNLLYGIMRVVGRWTESRTRWPTCESLLRAEVKGSHFRRRV